MEKLIRKKWLVSAVAALVLPGLLLPLAASANDVTVTIVAPAEVVEGGNFTARVNISAVVDFNSCDYYVTYDPAVVEVTGVSNGLIDGTEMPVSSWGLIPPGVQGTVRVIQYLPGATGVTGEGYLADIQFHVVGTACNTSALDLNDGTLNDNIAQVIPAEWIDDSVHVYAPPEQEVTVTMDAPAEVVEGGDFTARVNISQVEDFNSCDYYVTYDPAVIEVTDVTSGLIDSTEMPVSSWGLIPPGVQGTVRVIQYLPIVDSVTGEGYLAEIDFDVVGTECDTSELDLHDGTLNDIEAIPIPATWVDDSVHVYAIPTEITYNCTLAVGWNYISLPLIPEDDDIEVVLASLEGKYDQIWAYVDGEWQVYLPGQPDEYYIITGLTKLEKMADGLGYAIKMTEVGNLTGTGLEIEIGAIVPPTYPISVSWNLVGFKTMDFNSDGEITQSDDTMKARHYLKTMDQDADGEIIGDEVWYLRFYDPDTDRFYELYDSSNMLVCRGYWLYARVAGEISPPIEPEL